MNALVKTLRKRAKTASKKVADNSVEIENLNESVGNIFRLNEIRECNQIYETCLDDIPEIFSENKLCSLYDLGSLFKRMNYLKQRETVTGVKMEPSFIYNLKLPCKNRGIKLSIDENINVTMDGKPFLTQGQCEKYIASKPRIDFGTKESVSMR
ncbi:hypothetical protein KAR91_55765 [Candidatus Pacearchaeota archaeon]|nr:hypothetical protein [Candidatus Pacearchaeota archaeon]